MKGFKKTSIAASVAALLAASSSVAFANAENGVTTTSQTVTVEVMFDTACGGGDGSEWESHRSSGWYPLFVAALAESSVGAGGWNEFGSRLTADITFDVTQRGLNGATNEVDLAANISGVQYSFGMLSHAFGAQLQGGFVQQFTDETDVSVHYWGMGNHLRQAESEQNTSVVTSVKGANITEFNSSLQFYASGFEARSLEAFHEMVLFAAQQSGLGNAELWSAGMAMAMTSAMAESQFQLNVDVRYNKELGAGTDGGEIVIDGATATLACGIQGGGGVYFDVMTETDAGNGGGIIITPWL